jgi:MFS family permease
MAEVPPARVTALIVSAELLSMLGFASFAVTLPDLSRRFGMDPTQAGIVGGAFYAGYVAAVPLLVGLTDRVSARPIYLASCAVGAVAALGFSQLAQGFWSASLLRAVAGASLAGTYMPGLRLLTERLPESARLRAVPYYTSSFGLGASGSFLVVGLVAPQWGWRAAYAIGGVGCALAGLLAALATRAPARVEAAAGPSRHPLDFGPALRDPRVRAFVLAYAGHCWELFALRAWLVAYLVFLAARETGPRSITGWSTALVLAGVPASILGAETATAVGRSRLLSMVAWSSVGVGLLAGGAGYVSFDAALVALFLYTVASAADSGALTTGAIAAAPPGAQGATLAIHSLLGFLGGALGPAAVGWVLQRSGGVGSPRAWLLAFGTMALGSAVAGMAAAPRRAASDHK